MIDLRTKLRGTSGHLKQCLTKSKDKGTSLGLVYYHTHPNYGQSHIYIIEDVSGDPEDEVLGQAIDYVLEYDGWVERSGWWEGETTDGKLEMIILNGTRVPVETNEQFNALWASDVAEPVRNALVSIDASLLPQRVVVEGENGEARSDWSPRDRR